MKKLITYTLASLLLIVSCRKGDNPRLPDSVQVPPPLITVDPTGDATINVQTAQTADAFNGKFKVDLYFKEGAKPRKFDIVVIKNGDASSAKTLAANVTTFPTTLTVTGVQLHTLFGAAIVLGDSFTVGANITTTDGRFYPAFPTAPGAAAFSSGILSAPGFSPTATFSAVCQFHITDYGAIGSTVQMTVVRDDWADYTPPQTIPVTIVDATHFSFKYSAHNAQPIVIAVNPATNGTSVTKQVIGDYQDGNGNYFAVSPASNPANFVLPCELKISVALDFSVTGGTVPGDFVLILQAP